MFIFYHNIDIRGEPARPDLAITSFDSFFLTHLKRQKLEMLTVWLSALKLSLQNLNIKYLNWFHQYSIFVEARFFAIFS